MMLTQRFLLTLAMVVACRLVTPAAGSEPLPAQRPAEWAQPVGLPGVPNRRRQAGLPALALPGP